MTDATLFDHKLFKPALRAALKNEGVCEVADLIALETAGEADALFERLRREANIGQSQIDRLRGFTAGLCAMADAAF